MKNKKNIGAPKTGGVRHNYRGSPAVLRAYMSCAYTQHGSYIL